MGTLPAAELLFIGALVWPRPGSDPRPVLALVADDDLADPANTELLQQIRAMLAAGEPLGPVLVLDWLRRQGGPSAAVGDRLLQATTCGAVPEALPSYAAAVVAAGLRRRVESAGVALTAAAASMAEADLSPLAERAVAGILECAGRLDTLRGGVH